MSPDWPQGALRHAAPWYRDFNSLQPLLPPPLQVVPQVPGASNRLSLHHQTDQYRNLIVESPASTEIQDANTGSKDRVFVFHLQGSQSGEQRLIVFKQRAHVQTEASAEEPRQTTANTKQNKMKKLQNRLHLLPEHYLSFQQPASDQLKIFASSHPENKETVWLCACTSCLPPRDVPVRAEPLIQRQLLRLLLGEAAFLWSWETLVQGDATVSEVLLCERRQLTPSKSVDFGITT